VQVKIREKENDDTIEASIHIVSKISDRIACYILMELTFHFDQNSYAEELKSIFQCTFFFGC
jgi:hypothetical protein